MSTRASNGSISRLSNNRYKITITIGYDPHTGRQKRKSKTIRGSRRVAERELAKLLNEDFQMTANSTLTVSELVDLYLQYTKQKVRRQTYDEYARLSSRISIAPFANIHACDLYKHEKSVRDWLDEANTDTIRQAIYRTLRQIMNFGKKHHYITVNVCDFIDEPKAERKEIETITLDTLPAYLEAVKGTDIEAGVLLMLYCGLRRSEALARRWSDIEVVEVDGMAIHRLSVHDCLRERKGGGVEFLPTKTEKSKRIDVIPPVCATRLDEIREVRGGMWICERNGEVMRPDYFCRRWRACERESGLVHIKVKNLRHSCGTMLIREMQASIADVAELLGHTTTRTTERFYLQQNDASKLRVASLWEQQKTSAK